MRKIIIILDGLADQINTKTSLELAKTPNLDKLVKKSKAGLMYPIKNIAPESGAAQFVILGNNLKDFPGRGIIEALGANIKIKPNHTYLRVNFAKIKNNKLINIREPIPNNIKKLNNKNIKIYPTKGYRAVLEIKGRHKIKNTHPGYKTYKNYSKAINVKLKRIIPKNKLLNNYIKQVEKTIENRTILVRGASYKLPKVKSLKNWSIAADMPVEKGLGKLLKMKIIKKQPIKQLLKTKTNLYIQIKDADPQGHRGNKRNKIKAIEKIDKSLKPLIKLKDTIAITADHATPPNLKRHSKDPVPYLIYNKKSNNIKKFTEKACKRGKTIQGKDLMKLL